MSVTYAQEGDVAVLTLDRPDVFNSIDRDITDGMVENLARAGRDARAAVITGAGRAFCAGADLGGLMGEYEESGPDLEQVIRTRFNPIVEALIDAPVPTVAAVNGAAAGAGMGLALACDLRVMAESAFFMSAFINVALIPDTGSSWLLTHIVGTSRAMEIAFTGRRVPADEALALGLVHRIVTRDRLLTEATAWAGTLADGPTEAYLRTRSLLHATVSTPLRESLVDEARIQGELGRRPAHVEGVRAFLQKRTPDFRTPGEGDRRH